nr:MAG TPA: hypothetical protein [Caudoviricetes sp.]
MKTSHKISHEMNDLPYFRAILNYSRGFNSPRLHQT